MIYFDNAATTFPKPIEVKNAADKAITYYGGNPGRSGHKISLRVAEQVYKSRHLVGEFFGAKTENVVFTQNCTHALNLAIKGIMNNGGHLITSSLEHNSVARPIYALSRKNITYSIAQVSENDDITIQNFEKLITKNTKAIVCTIASNVTGQILPYKRIGELCEKYNICYIADGAQACGIIPLKISDGFNFICGAGHKGLYGPTGTGVLISDGKYKLSTIVEGGTGATSDRLEQTDFLPEMLESGTVNTVGIISLGAGINYINNQTISKMYNYEHELCNIFINGIKDIKGIKIYRYDSAQYAPIVSFNIDGFTSFEVNNYLNDNGFALRGGLQCAAITHKYMKTVETGVVRFSPSTYNTKNQVYSLIKSLKKYQ